MTWSPDGRHLAYLELYGAGYRNTRAWLLDTMGPGTSVAASRPLPAPDQGCQVRSLAWQPGSGLLAISESCPASPQLVYVEAPGGQPVSRPYLTTQAIIGLDFDPSGRNLLYTMGDPASISRSDWSTWRYDGTRAVEIGKGFVGPVW